MSEKKVIKKSDWIANFNLVGKPKINDFTFKIDQTSNKSNWIYNSMNLGIDCGEHFGVVYCDLMGGYSADSENKIFVHGKKDDDSDDFNSPITVDWNDRFNEDILEEVGRMSFIDVGLEKTSENKTYYKHFLSPYDAIAYIREHLREDMVVNVRGTLKYSEYNGSVQVKKNVTSIALSKVDNPADFKATFIQSILLDKDSASLKNIDKDKGVMFVDARVLDYLKEKDGIEVKGQYPYRKQFEFAMDFSNEVACKKIMDKLFKVKKNVTQIAFEGNFVEGGATIATTWEDVPDDIKDLVDMGVYSKEEALAKCTANGGREKRMVMKKPYIKLVGDDKTPVIQKFEEQYTEDDLYLDYLYKNKNNDDKTPFNVDDGGTEGDTDLDWLNQL